jgi:transcriptional regulator with XRE-family HTH domain
MARPGVFAQLFKFLRTKRGLGQKQVAGKLHCELQSVSNWETGRFLPDIARFPVIYGRLRLREQEYKALGAAYNYDRAQLEKNTLSSSGLSRRFKDGWSPIRKKIPVLHEKDTVNPLIVPELWEWPGSYTQKPVELDNRFVGAFFMENDSMAPKFRHGDLIFFDMTQMTPKPNEFYIVCINDQVCCRLLAKHSGSRYVFKEVGSKGRTTTVTVKEIGWLYRVVLKTRRVERYITFPGVDAVIRRRLDS